MHGTRTYCRDTASIGQRFPGRRLLLLFSDDETGGLSHTDGLLSVTMLFLWTIDSDRKVSHDTSWIAEFIDTRIYSRKFLISLSVKEREAMIWTQMQ